MFTNQTPIVPGGKKKKKEENDGHPHKKQRFVVLVGVPSVVVKSTKKRNGGSKNEIGKKQKQDKPIMTNQCIEPRQTQANRGAEPGKYYILAV